MKDIYVTPVFKKIALSKKNQILNIGGARSSKSYSILQYLIAKLTNEKNKKILICRKTLPALKVSTYQPFLEMLKQYNLYFLCDINKQDRTIRFLPTQSFIYFTSIDDPEKIKSTEFNYIFMEELNEFDYEDYITLKLRLSAPSQDKQPNKLLMAMNPIVCWVNEKLLNDNEIEVIKSTYKDNPFLSQEYINMLEQLKDIDLTYWKIYGLGEFAEISNLIYQMYEIIPLENYPPIEQCDEVIYGLDFGYNNPTALVEIRIKDKKFYERELIYQTKLTNADLIELLKQKIFIGHRHFPIYADVSEPNRIEEIYRAGFNIKPANDSVKDGIDFVERLKIYSCNENVNLNRERKFYKWQIDKKGNILDKPVKFNDHLMDAERYALYTHYHQEGKTDKKGLEAFLEFYQNY
jgi:phage terminase large subunit